MGILTVIKNAFTGGAVKSIENIALEWIGTDIEKAESKALLLKAMDPNGKMRRDISRAVIQLYALYIITMFTLIILEFFGIGGANGVELDTSTGKLKDLFVPITAMMTAIVGGSFGVNVTNAIKDK